MAAVALKNNNESVGTVRVIRDPEFAKRFNQACDDNPLVPPLHHGRLGWVKREMFRHFGLVISAETVRKWFAGESRPTPDNITKLAEVLQIDEAWLAVGKTPDLMPREQKVRNTMADGAVNLVCGAIQMSGGHPAFPSEGDKRAERERIDLYAIIKGAQYAMHVALAQDAGSDGWKFVVPTSYQDVVQIGVVQESDLAFRFLEITAETIEARGKRNGSWLEVSMTPAEANELRLKTFRERL